MSISTDDVIPHCYVGTMLGMTKMFLFNTKVKNIEYCQLTSQMTANCDLTYNSSYLKLPTKPSDIYAYYLKGKLAIFNSLPHEDVREIHGHACILLNEKLHHILAHGMDIEWLQDCHGQRLSYPLNTTKAATKLLSKCKRYCWLENSAYGALIFWSDGFVTSWVKQIGNNVWVLTVTVFYKDGNNQSWF